MTLTGAEEEEASGPPGRYSEETPDSRQGSNWLGRVRWIRDHGKEPWEGEGEVI